jgi:hypothetical protein
MILAHNFGQRFRPQPIGQRTRRVVGQSSCFEQISHMSS